MRVSYRTCSFVFCIAASLLVPGRSYADTLVTGNEFAGYATNPLPTTAPSVAPTDTFTLSNPSGNVFSFLGDSSTTLTGFLTAGGDTLAYTGGVAAPVNGSLFWFTGFIDLAPGTYNFEHTGAMYLTLGAVNGVQVINSPDPTAGLEDSSFNIASDTGLVYFQMLYGVSGDGPYELSGGLAPTAATPEPSSFLLLGSGLLAAGGLIRRRAAAITRVAR